MSMDIGIDLGTANVLIYIKGKGIVMREPSVVAIDNDTNRILAIGEDARRMIGRTPGNIVAIRPLRDGVIANYEITEQMIRYFIGKVSGRRFMFRPRVMICVPSRITTVEKRAVQEAAMQAGASHAELIEEPMAAAMGAGLDVAEPNGCMVVDIGGGTTDVAVISLGGVVVSDSLRMAGDKFDDCIITYIKNKHNVMIGERTAETIKIEVGQAFAGARDEKIEIRGRDLITGLPKTIEVKSDEVSEALAEPVSSIVQCVKRVLEDTPPELSSDIMDEILESLKVDYILRLPMNLDIFNMSPDEFLDALCYNIDVVGIAIGTNFTFGAKGVGNPKLMRERLCEKGIHIIVEPLLSTKEGPICSTNIRKAIEEGHMEQATAWLGRPYQFRGIVIKGDQRGRTLGFPTINFLLPNEMAIPPDGVYANRVCIDGIWYDGVGNIGDNPTFKNQYHRCEVHVFDFDQDVYGKEVTVQFISYIRGEVKFNNLQELIDQMKIDEETAIRILRNNP